MTTTATAPTRLSPTVDRFLEAIGAGAGVPAHVLGPGMVLDATVPDWRFDDHGAEEVACKYGAWFAAPAAFKNWSGFWSRAARSSPTS
jgi:hypothetical protein